MEMKKIDIGRSGTNQLGNESTEVKADKIASNFMHQESVEEQEARTWPHPLMKHS